MGKYRQQVKMLTQHDSIEDRYLDVGDLYAVAPQTFEFWGLDSLQQAKDPETGNFAQVISDISAFPITIFRDREVKKDNAVKRNINAIALEAAYNVLAYIRDRKQHDKLMKYLGIIATILTVALAAMYVLKVSGG